MRNETPNDLPVFIGEQDQPETQKSITQENNGKEDKGSTKPSENGTDERLDEAKKKKKKKDQKKAKVQSEDDLDPGIKDFLSSLPRTLKTTRVFVRKNKTSNTWIEQDLAAFRGEQDQPEPRLSLTHENNKENKGSKKPSENETDVRLDEAKKKKKKKKKKDQMKSKVPVDNDLKIETFLSTLDSSLKKIENNSPSTNGICPAVKCSRCKKDLQNIKRCGACNLVPYCGLECLRKDREAHKRSCDEKQMQFYRENINPVVQELLEATK